MIRPRVTYRKSENKHLPCFVFVVWHGPVFSLERRCCDHVIVCVGGSPSSVWRCSAWFRTDGRPAASCPPLSPWSLQTHTESRSDTHTDNTEASWEHVAVQKSSDKTISECIETSGEKTSEMVRFMLLYGLKRTWSHYSVWGRRATRWRSVTWSTVAVLELTDDHKRHKIK